MKAIHNLLKTCTSASIVVINHKTTKFESNSQPSGLTITREKSCYQSQNYKI